MEPPLRQPQLGINRVLLVADDPMAGAALQQKLVAQGADVFWARDSMEARWLWLPNFYTSVIIRLNKDSTGAEALIHRIKTDDPKQPVSIVHDVQDVSGMKKPPHSAQPAKSKSGTLLHMPKRKRQPSE